MEIQRALVLTAIAVVTYMMILAWQRDYSELPESQVAATETAPSADVPTAAPASAPEEPDAVPSGQDIPVAAEVAPEAVEEEPPQSTDANMEVLVKTDVMTVVIDRRGGDITRVDLPRYPRSAGTPDIPFTLLEQGPLRTYIAQTGLVGKNGTDTRDGRPTWQAEQMTYTLSPSDTELNVDLTLFQEGNVKIIKRYTFMPESYLVRISHVVMNNGSEPWQGALYGQLRRDGADDPSMNNAGFIPMPTYLGGAYWTEEKPFNKIDFDDMRDEPLKLRQQGGWIAMLQHYFVSAWIPDPLQQHTYSSVYLPSSNQYLMRFVSPSEVVQPEQQSVLYAELYVGPKDQDRLESISPGLNMTVDYGWLWFIAQPIFAVLVFLQSGQISIFGNEFDIGAGVGNWGVAIILLTLLIKLLFFKLSASSYRSMAKMRKVAPEMQRIREQHKNDRQKQSMEMMKLYQKEKINPLGGCLPILVQMPVFIALYYVLLESVELRQAPFFGWIQDLSVMDPYFILPLLMGFSMFVQTRLNPTPPDPTQAQVMKWMPVIFTVFFLWFPAGLVLYWLTNNILSITQQWVITRRIESE